VANSSKWIPNEQAYGKSSKTTGFAPNPFATLPFTLAQRGRRACGISAFSHYYYSLTLSTFSMTIRRLLPLAFLTSFALASCEKEDITAPTETPLLATHWQLARVDAFPVEASSYSETSKAYLEMLDLGKCTVGLGPCNNFSGRFSLGTNGRLSISPQISTRATCPVQALETQYLDNLALTARYEISSGELRLFDATTATPRLVFRQAGR
jgi:heat shock protein HslJ